MIGLVWMPEQNEQKFLEDIGQFTRFMENLR